MRHGFALISIAAISALLAAAAPAAPSLEGYWKGSSIVSHKGAEDRVECRVHYTRAGGKSFSYTATCAMESGKGASPCTPPCWPWPSQPLPWTCIFPSSSCLLSSRSSLSRCAWWCRGPQSTCPLREPRQG